MFMLWQPNRSRVSLIGQPVHIDAVTHDSHYQDAEHNNSVTTHAYQCRKRDDGALSFFSPAFASVARCFLRLIPSRTC